MKYAIQGCYVGESFVPSTNYTLGDIEEFDGDESGAIDRVSELRRDGYFIFGLFDEYDNRIAV